MASPTEFALQQVDNLSRLPLARQIGVIVGLAATIALGVAIINWSQSPDYQILFPDATPGSSAEVAESLDQLNMPYQIDAKTGIITVPAEILHEARIRLAANGIAPNRTKGFDVLDEEPALGASDFLEKARFNRALQEELAASIAALDNVQSARVHLAIPKQTSYLRSHDRPSASVVVKLQAGRSLNRAQIAGITNLVAASVPGMEEADVSIIDHKGNLLSAIINEGMNSDQFRLIQQIEDEYSKRIVRILTPVLGEGNIRTQVAAELDFTSIETTKETYNPAGATLRSEQITEENASGAEVTSAEPPAEGQTQGTAVGKVRRSTRNFEIDRSISQIKEAPPSIRKLTIAVLVDLKALMPAPVAAATPAAEGEEAAAPTEEALAAQEEERAQLEADKLAQMTQLVKEATGFNPERGDRINVVNMPFLPVEAPPEPESPSLLQEAWNPVMRKQLLAGAALLLLIFGVLRPTLLGVANSPTLRRSAAVGPDWQAGTEPHGISDDKVTLSGGDTENQIQFQSASELLPHEKDLAMAKEIVQKEPARVANMLRSWMNEDSRST